MIRKVIIVLLTLGAVASGSVGVLCGSGCSSRAWEVWTAGEPGEIGSRGTFFLWGTSRLVQVIHLEFLDASAIPSDKHRLSGPGWTWQTSIVLNEPSGLYVRSTSIIVSFFIPIVLALLSGTYPVIAFIRGPARRWRRRRKGKCVACGYDLTGNVSGTCPECGKEVEAKRPVSEPDDH